MEIEQLYFLEPIKKPVKEPIKKHKKYDATICNRCLCSRCNKNCETHVSHMNKEECLALEEPCWNCDECYYYGMDNESLSKDIVRFECENFEMTTYFIELKAKRRRRNLKIIRRDKNEL